MAETEVGGGLVRVCPECGRECRPHEMYCNGTPEQPHDAWSLFNVSLVRSRASILESAGQALPAAAETKPEPVRCRNGHAVPLGDLMCPTCHELLPEPAAGGFGEAQQEGFDAGIPTEPPLAPTIPKVPETTVPGEASSPNVEFALAPSVIDGWRVEARVSTVDDVCDTFRVIRVEDQQSGTLTLYCSDKEPDTTIYEAWSGLPRDHVPELLATGRFDNRPYDVTEEIEQTLRSLPTTDGDGEALRPIVLELSKALRDFGERGLRHRDLTPDCILIRAMEPLDLVVTGFGSARQSAFDLDVVSPLEMTFYSAPESLSGTVSPSSDWWSLGIILLERATEGACFEGVNHQVFLMHAATVGVSVPKDLPEDVSSLLHGLLIRDTSQRWAWPEVEAWLEGRSFPLPADTSKQTQEGKGATISLGGSDFDTVDQFALAAADATHWREARERLARGEIATWAADMLPKQALAKLRRLTKRDDVDADTQLMCALLLLNNQMPLVREGNLVTPAWLLENPIAGYDLIGGPVPDILSDWDLEPWLVRLKTRAKAVRDKADQLEIQLDEEVLKVFLLATSQARLKAQWEAKRNTFPDAVHGSLASLIERNATSETDLIILLSADAGQFRTRDAILDDAAKLARRNGVRTFDTARAAEWLSCPRRGLIQAVRQQTGDLARCNVPRLDEWVEQLRIERRLQLERLLVVLAIPADAWIEPPKQDYYQRLLDFFEKKVTVSLTRGPLVRMTIGKTTPRIDLCQLGTARKSADQALAHLLDRTDGMFEIDPAVFADDTTSPENRLRRLDQNATLYKRDTGIDGLYLGFPFLLLNEAGDTRQPRIAPILLWPIKLEVATGVRGNVKIAFDNSREDVRLNPALEGMLATEELGRWRDLMDELLAQTTLSQSDVMDAFATRLNPKSRDLGPLPAATTKIVPGTRDVIAAAVIFNVDYAAQAIVDDIRGLKRRGTDGTALANLLRMTPPANDDQGHATRGPEVERFFTAPIDPSQEAAVVASRQEPGVLLEGPPGTGKSQTIVNMVTDAIGHGRSVLVVCQKQAALDVVRKRLEAQNLEERFVMVKDVNRDRQPILRQVRDQAFAELSNRGQQSNDVSRDRMRLAGLIEQLEGDLDTHHRATLDINPALGLSYRELIAELIELEGDEGRHVDAPSLRTALEAETRDNVSRLANETAALAPLWRSAKYEDSALGVLKPFSPAPHMVNEFAGCFVTFRESEADRLAAQPQTTPPFEVDDHEVSGAWVAEARERLRNMTDEHLELIGRSIDYFQPGVGAETETVGTNLLHDTHRLTSALNEIGIEPASTLHRVLRQLTDSELASAVSFAERAQRPATFWSFLDFGRRAALAKARKLLQRFARPTTDDAYGALHEALSFEHRLRPLRRSLHDLRTVLGLAENQEPSNQLTVLRLTAAELARGLQETHEFAKFFSSCPRIAEGIVTLRRSDREALSTFLQHIEAASERAARRATSKTSLVALEPWLSDEWRGMAANVIDRNGSVKAEIDTMEDALPTLVPYQEFRRRAAAITPKILNLLGLLRRSEQQLACLSEGELRRSVRNSIAREARLAWKQNMETREPLLLRSQGETAAKVEELAGADDRMRDYNQQFIADKLDRNAVLGPQRSWQHITRLRGAAGIPRSSIRDMIEQGRDLGLFELRPVWLMNPDVASRVLPLTAGLFDLVIYDEASQMPVEYALPTLFRASVAVVSGDEKQMPPTAFFAGSVADDEDLNDGALADVDQHDEAVEEMWNKREIKDCPDLLQLGRGSLPSRTLEVHYRSAYRELISFSNAAFYGNRLNVPVHHPHEVVSRVKPIEVIRVDGTYEKRTNQAEAEQAVRYLAKLWRKRERPSVGVVTFNKDQANLILEKIEEYAEQNDGFRRALVEEQSRTRDHEDIGFFVKNVENVQGDERDLILFSTTFGLPPKGKFRRNFGVLGQSGGRRRLNVAITRARVKIVLLTSIPVSEVSDMLSTNRSPEIERDYIQGYLAYSEAVSGAKLDIGKDICKRMVTEGRRRDRLTTAELDAFASSVKTFIDSLGYDATATASADAFAVDLAIADPKSGSFVLGIECDAPDHSVLATARAREIWRRQVLSGTIANIHRISCVDWYGAPVQEQERLRSAIETALAKGSVAA